MKIGDEMKTFYLTDAGKVRGHNEDSVTILKNKSNEYLIFLSSSSLLQLTKPANNITIKPSIEALKVIFL